MPSKHEKWEPSVYVRGNGGKGSIFYYQLKDPVTGTWTTARSTRTANRKEAVSIAKREAALRDAENTYIHISAKMGLNRFVELFYDEEKSPWLTEKRERDMNALQSDHVRAMRSYYVRYLSKLIGRDFTIGDVTPYWLGQLQRMLRMKYPTFSEQKLNVIIASLVKALKYAVQQWIIPKDPTSGIVLYAVERRITGTFTQDEIRSLRSLEWDNPMGKLAFLLAIHTGMRMGEVQALRIEDLESRESMSGKLYLVHVSHSWSKTHGLKCPKNGKPRIVPIPDWLWYELRSMNAGAEDVKSFVFPAFRRENPVTDKVLRAALRNALEQIGVTVDQQEERNLRFHSARHYFNSALAPLVQNESLRKVIGHSSPEMTEHYHHVTEIELEMVAEAQKKAFSVIPFPVEEVTA